MHALTHSRKNAGTHARARARTHPVAPPPHTAPLSAGQYFDGFEKQRVKLSVLSGDLVLKNLRVRHDALASFLLPFKARGLGRGRLFWLAPLAL
eukprot:4054259-Pleurochrysis_carterae.AAC.1